MRVVWAGFLAFLAGCSFEPDGVWTPDRGDAPAAGDLQAPPVKVDGQAPLADPPADAPPPDGAPAVAPCPADYVERAGSSYRFAGGEETWLDAELDCEGDGPFSHLIVMDDDGRETEMMDEVAGTSLRWVGLSSRRDYGVWRWVTGETAETSSLISFGLGRCGAAGYGQLYSSVGCDERYRYVCECDGVPAASDSY